MEILLKSLKALEYLGWWIEFALIPKIKFYLIPKFLLFILAPKNYCSRHINSCMKKINLVLWLIRGWLVLKEGKFSSWLFISLKYLVNSIDPYQLKFWVNAILNGNRAVSGWLWLLIVKWWAPWKCWLLKKTFLIVS